MQLRRKRAKDAHVRKEGVGAVGRKGASVLRTDREKRGNHVPILRAFNLYVKGGDFRGETR